MEEFDPIEKKIKTTKETMNFVQEFLQKKYGFGILFFVLFVVGIASSITAYKQGKADQAINSAEQIKSLLESGKNDNDEIKTLNGRVAYYKKKNDSCETSSLSENIEGVLQKRLEENDRIKALINARIEKKDNETNRIETLLNN